MHSLLLPLTPLLMSQAESARCSMQGAELQRQLATKTAELELTMRELADYRSDHQVSAAQPLPGVTEDRGAAQLNILLASLEATAALEASARDKL